MQMISFIFFGLVAVIFILLISINKIFKDDRKAIKITMPFCLLPVIFLSLMPIGGLR